ncbi:MAG: Polar-differentiation response regulator DivK [Rhodocyclaceae bacterium]|nr:MAG: response regulator [Rhodocyclaceae bacterium]MBV6407812.1 Polar-differentiation response regulator DivK [Rhodocyclaceae bacterium]CAG0941304.1 Polar-differentiation response regulator DivK [Gammaproteobacteria bacterium]
MKRILLVEDNDKNLKLLRDVLQADGYGTLEAMSAGDGIALAISERPDLILMDIQLPDMNGAAALRRLRADAATAAIPVLAVTASVMQNERNSIVAAGFDGFLGKPFALRELLDLVRRTLEATAP